MLRSIRYSALRSVAALVVALFVVMLGLPAVGAADNVVKVGAAVSLTGKLAKEGQLVRHGYDFYVDYINSRGGFDVAGKRHKFELKYYDDESDAKTSAKLVEKLISTDGIKLIMSSYSSGIALASSAITEKYRAVMLGTAANADPLFERGYKYFFGVLKPASYNLQETLAMPAMLEPKAKTVAFVVENTLWPLTTAEAGVEWAKKYGMQVVMFEKYAKGTQDFSTLLTQMKSKNVDVVVHLGYVNDAILLMKQAKELRFSPKNVAFGVGPTLPDFTQALGDDANFATVSTFWTPTMKYTGDIIPSAAEYATLFEKKYGYTPDFHAAVSSAALLVLQKAVQAAGTTDSEKVRAALQTVNLKTFYGDIKFDDKGRNTAGKMGVIQIQNQKRVVVWPAEIAEAKPVYPTPSWERR